MNNTVTKDDLINMGYPKYTAIGIIRQAKVNMVKQGYALYNNKRLGRVPTEAVESILGFEIDMEDIANGEN